MKPYSEEIINGVEVIRTFSASTPEEELKWHWDEETRIIEALEHTDWQFQFDNELPMTLNQQIRIPVGVIHRVIKGAGDLVLRIIKLPNN